ncbi:low-density lipoprotein receptor-related protein 12-like [Mya arenaria]|uniref:low-density lipoprotein receptor-related protein 12-like n=1 Tax=Mya arenaria TaxID=6604 RepID=UPI0022E7435A|nr:low-density lipoprotein receptor-related protein 12-like [Mya arenaria]
MCVVTYITLCWLSGYTFAIHTYFMNQHCGTTIDFRKMSLHAIKLHLTTNSVYLPKLDCTMTVNATSTMQFMLYFKKMDISCDHDWLELHDGLSVSSPYVNGFTYRQCGHFFRHKVYTTSENAITVRFHSNSSVGSRGFAMVLTAFHTGNCKSKEYHCNNGRCIADSLVCNGYNPCGDDSDCILTGTEIVGIIVGTLVFFGTIIGLIFCFWRTCRYRYVSGPRHVVGYRTLDQGYDQPIPQQYGAT